MNMKKLFLLFALIAVSISAFYFFKKDTKKTLLLVNVLSKELYDDMHILGSEQISYEDIEKTVETTWKNYDKNTVFVFYCSNYACSASGESAEILTKAGFNKAFAYEGGMSEWFNLHSVDKSYKIVGVGKQSYLHLPNMPKEPAPNTKTITAEELKTMLIQHKVKGY
jgi:rhodanese-related sulfurtransferase